MRLNLRISTAASRVEKIRFHAALVELFDAYVEFYKTQLNAVLTTEQVVSEMLTAFIKSDRHFMQWYKERVSSGEKLANS